MITCIICLEQVHTKANCAITIDIVGVNKNGYWFPFSLDSKERKRIRDKKFLSMYKKTQPRYYTIPIEDKWIRIPIG